MKHIIVCVAGIVLLGMGGCNQEPSAEADTAAVKNVHEAFVDAYTSMDFEKFMSFIAEDAVWLPPNRLPLAGKEAIRAWYDFTVNDSVEASVQLDEIQVCGDWAFRLATWNITVTPKGSQEKNTFQNKSIQIFRRQPDGSWKVSHSIWNSNLPL